MCFHVSLVADFLQIEAQFKAQFQPTTQGQLMHYYHVSAFAHPYLPIITADKPDVIQAMRWGLIPDWAVSETNAADLQNKGLNARAETLWERPMFKGRISHGRALVLIDGFYEWQHNGDDKQPYYIHLKNGNTMAVGALWAEWRSPQNQVIHQTFVIITTAANPLLQTIHNHGERMPFIASPDNPRAWIEAPADNAELKSILQPLPQELLSAYPVSNLISRNGFNTNVPEVMRQLERPPQASLF